MSKLKKIPRLIHEWMMDFYPYFLCILGGIFFSVGQKVEGSGYWVGFFLAVFTWVFAIELAISRARSKAVNECSAKFVGFLTNGKSSEINVFIHTKRD